MFIIITMVFYIYGVIGTEFLNMRTDPPAISESPY